MMGNRAKEGERETEQIGEGQNGMGNQRRWHWLIWPLV